jgi:nucleolin
MSKAKQTKNFDAELSSDESSVPVTKKTAVKATKKVAKNDSDESSEEVNMLKNKKARANSGDKVVAKPTKKKAVESSDSESEKPKKTNGAKKPVAKKVDSDSEESSEKPKKAAVKAPAKKKVAESDDSSDEVPAKKAPVKAPAKKKVESDSDESSEVPAKKAPVKAPAKKKVDSDSDESSEVVPAKKAPAKKVESDSDEEIAVPQKQAWTAPETTGDTSCTELFLKNLSWNTDDNVVYNHFSQYGTVESTKVLYDKMTGKARGLGFVKFSTRAEAEAANKASNTVDGRILTTAFSDNKDAGRNNNQGGNQGGYGGNQGGYGGNQGGFQKVDYDGERHTIFVGNVGFKTYENSIKSFFDDCGQVVDVRIAKDRDTGRSKGFCHVDFASADAVQKAIAKAGQQLDGREVRVDASIPREGGSSRKYFLI